jgi:hypothetical protein
MSVALADVPAWVEIRGIGHRCRRLLDRPELQLVREGVPDGVDLDL